MNGAQLLYRPFGAIRILLAVLVMLSHGSFLLPSMDTILPRSLSYGTVAVFVFFVLSGLIITEAILKFYNGRPIQFFLNRLIRLYPPYLMTLAVVIVIFFMIPNIKSPNLQSSYLSLENLLANIFSVFPTVFITDWMLGVVKRVDLISVNWALRVEFAFYTIMAAIILFSRYSPILGIKKSALSGFAFIIFLCIHIYYFYISSDEGRGAFYSSFIPYFLIGVAWTLRRNSSEPNYWLIFLSLSFVLSLIQVAMFPSLNFAVNGEMPSLKSINLAPTALWCGLLALLVMLSNLHLKDNLIRKFDKWLGDLSYPIYLFHIPALYIVVNEPWFECYSGLFSYVVLTFLLALISELVCSRLFDRMRDKFRKTALKSS